MPNLLLLAEHEKILQEEREQNQKASMEHKQQIESLEGMVCVCVCDAKRLSHSHGIITAEYERMMKQEREQHEKAVAEHLDQSKSLKGNLFE